MLDGRSDSGFTIVEMIVSLVVMVIFATLLFQMFLVGTTQQGTVSARASAIDIAAINLSKIDSRDSPLLSSITCSTAATNNPNNLTINSSAAGSNITFTHESTSGTNLPSGTGTVQKMVALFPRGCTNSMPIEIISTVEYNGETITRATYVN